jgi:hypothetical protein
MPKPDRPVDQSLLTPDEQKEIAGSLPKGFPDLGTIDGVGQAPFSFGESPLVWFIIAPVALVLAGLCLIGAQHPPKENPERVVMIARIMAGVLGAFGLFGLICAIFLAMRPRLHRGERWVFFRRALVRFKWGKPTIFPWPELQIRKSSAAAANTLYELTGHGGDPVKLWYGVIGSRVLPLAMQGRHCEMVLPGLVKRVRAGQTVKFGPVGVSAEGLHHKKREIAWDEIETLEFPVKDSACHMRVRTGSGTADVNLSESVPNAWMMLELICEIEPRLVKPKWDEFHGEVA